MSEQDPTDIQQKLQLLNKYSQSFKNPIRNMISETNEAVLNSINSLINELIKKDEKLIIVSNEVIRLQELCKKNNIDIKKSEEPTS